LELILYSQAEDLLHNPFQSPLNAIYFTTVSPSVKVTRPS